MRGGKARWWRPVDFASEADTAVEIPDLRFRLKTGSVLAALISAQDLRHFSAAIFTVVFNVSPLAINGRERHLCTTDSKFESSAVLRAVLRWWWDEFIPSPNEKKRRVGYMLPYLSSADSEAPVWFSLVVGFDFMSTELLDSKTWRKTASA